LYKNLNNLDVVLYFVLVTLCLFVSVTHVSASEKFKSESHLQTDSKQFRLLAEKGDKDAQFRLGLVYESSNVPEKFKQSAYWYNLAAKQGHPVAQYNLGIQLMVGNGVEKNQQQALQLWLAAARSGLAHAQFNVARAYFLGVGLNENQDKARYWLEKAAAQNEPKSIDLLKQLGWYKELKFTKPFQVKANLKQTPLNIYKQPNSKSSLWFVSNNRESINIGSKQKNGWIKVNTEKNFPAWVHKDFIQEYKKGHGIITTPNVSVRANPSTQNSLAIGKLRRGEMVEIIDRQDVWYRLASPSRFEAWVNVKEL